MPLVGGIWLLILMAQAGDKGYNDYGPDPLEETMDDPDDVLDFGETQN